MARVGVVTYGALTICHAVADLQVRDLRTHRLNHARGLESQDVRQGVSVKARAEIDSNEVQAHRFLEYSYIVILVTRNIDPHKPQAIGAAVSPQTERFNLIFHTGKTQC